MAKEAYSYGKRGLLRFRYPRHAYAQVPNETYEVDDVTYEVDDVTYEVDDVTYAQVPNET